jgi:glycosyltransferase involved in cell wall biosynthesis
VKFTIVTLSFNQAEFIERTIRSVIEQEYRDKEYIVFDSGSNDGSHRIINRYRGLIDKVVFDFDHGPAYALNKGFREATGEIFGFLNSDDILYPGAIERAAECFRQQANLDIVSGDSILIDADDTPIRRLFSDKFSVIRYAYGANFIAQQSTFFRSSIFRKAGGFNKHNRCAWDGELFVDMALAGGRFAVVRDFWSGFRSHPASISASGRFDQELGDYGRRIFRKILGREMGPADFLLKPYHRIVKHLLNPRGIGEHIRHGAVYGRLRSRR